MGNLQPKALGSLSDLKAIGWMAEAAIEAFSYSKARVVKYESNYPKPKPWAKTAEDLQAKAS